MAKVLEAIYKEGVLEPLEDPGLRENQRVMVELRAVPSPAEAKLKAWQGVYEGLSESDIDEIEEVALDRSGFMNRP